MWQLEYLHIIEDEGDYESAVELHTAIMTHGPNIVKGEVGNIVVQHSLLMVEWEIASWRQRFSTCRDIRTLAFVNDHTRS